MRALLVVLLLLPSAGATWVASPWGVEDGEQGIVLANPGAAQTVTIHNSSASWKVHLKAGEVRNWTMPPLLPGFSPQPVQAGWILDAGVRVDATQPLIVYAVKQVNASRLLSLAHPAMIDAEYVVTTSHFVPPEAPMSHNGFSVLATKDTAVQITYAGNTSQHSGAPEGAKAGEVRTYSLKAHEVLVVFGSEDLSGTHILASQPVAVSVGGQVHHEDPYESRWGHEILLPFSYASTRTPVCASGREDGVTVAALRAAEVDIKGWGANFSLGPRDVRHVRISGDVVVESSQPVQVLATHGGGPLSGAMMALQAPEMQSAKQTVYAPNTTQITVGTVAHVDVRLDGKTMQAGTPIAGYQCHRATVDRGFHTLEAPVGMAVTLNVLENATGRDWSEAATALHSDCRQGGGGPLPEPEADVTGNRIRWSIPFDRPCHHADVEIYRFSTLAHVGPAAGMWEAPWPKVCQRETYSLRAVDGEVTGFVPVEVFHGIVPPIPNATADPDGTLSWQRLATPGCGVVQYHVEGIADGRWLHLETTGTTSASVPGVQDCEVRFYRIRGENLVGNGSYRTVRMQNEGCPQPAPDEDSDGDGVPNLYDPCPFQADVHGCPSDEEPGSDPVQVAYRPVCAQAPRDAHAAYEQGSVVITWRHPPACVPLRYLVWSEGNIIGEVDADRQLRIIDRDPPPAATYFIQSQDDSREFDATLSAQAAVVYRSTETTHATISAPPTSSNASPLPLFLVLLGLWFARRR